MTIFNNKISEQENEGNSQLNIMMESPIQFREKLAFKLAIKEY